MNNDRIYYTNTRTDMLEFLPLKIEKSIEFGCSEGLFSKKVKEKFGAECWGVDQDCSSVEIAKQNLDRVLLGDALSILEELPDKYFDCLICNDFLEHLAYPELFILKIQRAMKNGAYLVASLPNVRSWSNVLQFLIYKDWNYKDSGILDNTHLRFFTMKSLKRFLMANNMTIEVFRGTRPSRSKVFYLFNIISLGFINDMKFSGIGVRAIFK